MSTSAAVFVESANKVVRVNSDGYPEYMVGALAYIEAAGLTEAFASQAEYSALVDSAERFETYVGYGFRDRGYIEVPGVGWAFAKDVITLTATREGDDVKFSQSENYHYILTTDGSVRLQDDAGKWVTFD